MKDKPVYWSPFEVGRNLSRYLESIALEPKAKDVDVNFRADLARVLAEVPVSDTVYFCFGRVRAGECKSIMSRAGRNTYGLMKFSTLPAPNLNANTEEGDYFDHQLLYARRMR